MSDLEIITNVFEPLEIIVIKNNYIKIINVSIIRINDSELSDDDTVVGEDIDVNIDIDTISD